jgi:uncharacterized membrane protein
MIPLILAALFFAGIHPLVSGTSVRARLVASIGEQRYRGLFSLLSLAGLVALILAYRAAPYMPVWSPPRGLRHAGALLMLAAFFFAVVGLMSAGPTAVGREALLRSPEPARGLVRVTRHPFLVGVTLWAATHLLVRGDAAAMILFSTFLFLGLTGPLRIDRRQHAIYGDDWQRFAAVTSAVPFAAILRGQNRLDLREIGAIRIGISLIVYVVFLFFGHQWLFGVAPLG